MKNLDNSDINILRVSCRNNFKFTSFSLTKILNPNIEGKNRELSDKNVSTIRKLNKLKRYGLLVDEIIDGKRYYSINKKNVLFGKSKVEICGKKFIFDNILMWKDDGLWHSIQFLS